MMGLMGDLGEFYPGSKERRQVNHVPDEEPEGPELGTGRMLLVRGFDVEFFEIGVLAAALNRRPVTIRMWEHEGILPNSGWSKPGKYQDARGRRRLWTRPQIVGIWRIAKEENVLEPGPRINITKTQFTARVDALFAQLRKEGLK
jgi:hypothetical protein